MNFVAVESKSEIGEADKSVGPLSLEPYNKGRWLVRGDRKKYGQAINRVGGRWNNRLEGWVVPDYREQDIKKLVDSLTPRLESGSTPPPVANVSEPAPAPTLTEKELQLKYMAEHARSRLEQTKYHRATSPQPHTGAVTSTAPPPPVAAPVPALASVFQPENDLVQYYKQLSKSPAVPRSARDRSLPHPKEAYSPVPERSRGGKKKSKKADDRRVRSRVSSSSSSGSSGSSSSSSDRAKRMRKQVKHLERKLSKLKRSMKYH
jgi:hypothetical protein